MKYHSGYRRWDLTKTYNGKQFKVSIANIEGPTGYYDDNDNYHTGKPYTKGDAIVFVKDIIPDAIMNIEQMIIDYKQKIKNKEIK